MSKETARPAFRRRPGPLKQTRWSTVEGWPPPFFFLIVRPLRKLKMLWEKFVHGSREFSHDEPGQRFLNAHKRWKGSGNHLAVRVALVGTGVLLVVIGVLLALIPGVPGIVLGVPGVGLIGTQFRWLATWLDWMESKCRRMWRRMRGGEVSR